MLQIFANAALHPKNHRILIDHGIPDLLSQLLLPSDDWYYNAHSTKYGLFVKHHVSRVLVYLGFQHRVNHKYSVFDYHIQGKKCKKSLVFLQNIKLRKFFSNKLCKRKAEWFDSHLIK